MGELTREPVFRNVTVPGSQKTKDAADQIGVFGGTDVAIIGNLADFP